MDTRAKSKRKKNSKKLNMAELEQINQLKEEIASLKNELSTVQTSVKNLQVTVTKLESDVAVSHQVTLQLKKEIDRQQQYSRRSCLLIKNVPTCDNETVSDVENKVRDEISRCFNDNNISNAIVDDLDKAHRVGPKEDLKQDIIVRFKSHSKRTLLYKHRNHNTNIKIRPLHHKIQSLHLTPRSSDDCPN